MVDLAKYGEIKHVRGNERHGGEEEVNKLLKPDSGWELITVKILEVNQIAEVHYILGRSRDYKTPQQVKNDRKERQEILEQR